MGAVIKRQLKENSKTLSEFCDDFNISRPTLNTYIKLYEDGEQLPNEVFQRIFDYLFDEDITDQTEFNDRYRYVQDYYHRRYTNRFTNDLLGYNSASERNYNSLLMTIQKDMVEKSISDDKFMIMNYILKNDDEFLDKYIDFFMCYTGTKKFNVQKYRDNKIIVLLYQALKASDQKMTQKDYELLEEFVQFNDEQMHQKTPSKHAKKVGKKLANLIEERYGYMSDQELDELFDELTKKINDGVTT